jgi:hypothetical protein
MRVVGRHRYAVYGMAVESDVPLALPEYSHGGLGKVECLSAPASVFRAAVRGVDFDPRSDSWHRYASLPDGSTYVQWDAVGEFLVAADGSRIFWRRSRESCSESFQVYMLGQALSFAMVKQRFEPLHATVVAVDDRAVAFLGNSASGKSTLAACFIDAGYRLLTDDLLVLKESSEGILAFPGPPRIKLFPRVARLLLGDTATSVCMNAGTKKLIVPLGDHRMCDHPVTLSTIYSLAAPHEACRTSNVGIETLSVRQAFVELLRGTFNRRLVSRDRLARQFRAMATLAGLVPVKRLAYPRSIDRLGKVRGMVLADVGSPAP